MDVMRMREGSGAGFEGKCVCQNTVANKVASLSGSVLPVATLTVLPRSAPLLASHHAPLSNHHHAPATARALGRRTGPCDGAARHPDVDFGSRDHGRRCPVSCAAPGHVRLPAAAGRTGPHRPAGAPCRTPPVGLAQSRWSGGDGLASTVQAFIDSPAEPSAGWYAGGRSTPCSPLPRRRRRRRIPRCSRDSTPPLRKSSSAPPRQSKTSAPVNSTTQASTGIRSGPWTASWNKSGVSDAAFKAFREEKLPSLTDDPDPGAELRPDWFHRRC